MSVVPVEVQVSQQTYETLKGLAKFIAAVKGPLSDGFQISDLPVLISAAVADLVPALNGSDKISSEYAEDPAAFVRAVELGLAELGVLLK